ncbi:MAG: hypothetical protein GX262_01515 [Clostridia bacterium]|jgi:hypothetical protein|nr:hypothetical protein [Clostridia bacterium]
MFAFIILDNDAILDHYQAHGLEKSLKLFYNRFTPDFEAYGPGEFFLDLGKETAARQIIYQIWEELVPVYGRKAVIGLGPSKLLCRAIALLDLKDLRFLNLIVEERPQGLLIILPVEWETKVRPRLPLEVLWPLDLKIRRQLLKLGFKTWGEIEAISPEQLKVQLGNDAYLTWELAKGQFSGSLQRPEEGIRVNIVWEEGMSNLGPALDQGAKQLAMTLEAQWLGCRELTLEGTTGAGRLFWRKRLFLKPCSSAGVLQGETRRLWHKLKLKDDPGELLLKAEGLEPMSMRQLSLFNESDIPAKEEQLQRLLNRLRKDYPASVLDRAVRWNRSRREQMLAFYDPWRF